MICPWKKCSSLPREVIISPAGFFSALGPLRQQHHRQFCQLQDSEPQHPHNPPRVPADVDMIYDQRDTNGEGSRPNYTDTNLPPIFAFGYDLMTLECLLLVLDVSGRSLASPPPDRRPQVNETRGKIFYQWVTKLLYSNKNMI